MQRGLRVKAEPRLPEDLWRRFCERVGRQSTVVTVRPIPSDQIVAVRLGYGLLGYFGLTRWIRRVSRP